MVQYSSVTSPEADGAFGDNWPTFTMRNHNNTQLEVLGFLGFLTLEQRMVMNQYSVFLTKMAVEMFLLCETLSCCRTCTRRYGAQ